MKSVRDITDQMIFRIGLCLAAACFITGIFFNHYYRVLEPVFLINDKPAAIRPSEDGSSWSAGLSLRYISDAKDERKLTRVEFSELRELGIDAMFENDQVGSQDNGNSGSMYVLHTVQGTIRGAGAVPESGTRLTRGTAFFLDGTSQEVELGTVTLFVLPEELLHEREPLAKKESSSNSSDGSAKLVYSMKKDAVLRLENGLIPPQVKAHLAVTANGKVLDGSAEIRLKEGDLLVLKGEWETTPSDSEEQMTDRKAAVAFALVSGEEKQPLLFTVSRPVTQERSSRYKLWRYLRERGAF